MHYRQTIVAGPSLAELRQAVFGGKSRQAVIFTIEEEWRGGKRPKMFQQNELTEQLCWPFKCKLIKRQHDRRRRGFITEPIKIRGIETRDDSGASFDFTGKFLNAEHSAWFITGSYDPRAGKGKITFSN